MRKLIEAKLEETRNNLENTRKEKDVFLFGKEMFLTGIIGILEDLLNSNELKVMESKTQAFDILKEHIMLNEDYWNEEIHIHINTQIIDDEEDVKIIKKALGDRKMIDKPNTIDFSKLVNNGYKAPYLPCLATQEVEAKAKAFDVLQKDLYITKIGSIHLSSAYTSDDEGYDIIKKALEVKENDNKSNL